MDRYEAYVSALEAEIPGFRIVRKDRSRLHRAIHHALVIVTLGRMRSYLDSFTTTIGKTVYVTSDWEEWTPDRRYITLRHEAVHLRQFRRLTLPLMAVVYILLPLPMGLAYGRAWLEREAYAETIRAAAEVWGRDYAASDEHRRYVIEQFLGPSYGWMWPFRKSLERWYEGVVATL